MTYLSSSCLCVCVCAAPLRHCSCAVSVSVVCVWGGWAVVRSEGESWGQWRSLPDCCGPRRMTTKSKHVIKHITHHCFPYTNHRSECLRRCGRAHLSLRIGLDLPASRELQMSISEFVEESDEVAVVLISLKVACVSPYFQNHVLQAGAVSKHPICTLRRKRHIKTSKIFDYALFDGPL